VDKTERDYKDVDLTAEDIFATEDIRTEKMYIPEWKGNVYIRQARGIDQDKFEKEFRGKDGVPNLMHSRARLVASSLYKSNGERMFTDDQVIKLSNKSGAVLNRLVDKITEINNITEADLDKIAKNS